jgi:hydroxymethylpyrimidine pyrophosphatase-like HAD family hydrolase
MKYRLAAIDLDGTLLSGPAGMSEANAAALRQLIAAGVHVAAGLTVPAIVCAGADVRDAASTPIAQHTVPADFAAFFLDLADRAGWKVSLTTRDQTYRRENTLPPWAATAPSYLRPITNFAGEPIDHFLTALIWSSEADAATRELEAWRGRVSIRHALTHDGEVLLTVTAPSIEKGTGLTALCAELGIAPEEAVVFGDSDVDLPMFEIAGLSVAMGNAEPAVKARAGFQAPHAAEDGVAAAIRAIWDL